MIMKQIRSFIRADLFCLLLFFLPRKNYDFIKVTRGYPLKLLLNLPNIHKYFAIPHVVLMASSITKPGTSVICNETCIKRTVSKMKWVA
jgi:hypothetical protein